MGKLTTSLKKLYYYRDWRLFFSTSWTAAVISIKISLCGCKDLVSLANLRVGLSGYREKEKVIKYCQFCTSLRNILGFNNSCLRYSLLLCRMLRVFGHEAVVHFGVDKIKGEFVGHCWVTLNEQEIITPYTLIFSCP